MKNRLSNPIVYLLIPFVIVAFVSFAGAVPASEARGVPGIVFSERSYWGETVPVGPEASSLGVLRYTKVWESETDLVVFFEHRDGTRSGELRVHQNWNGRSGRIFLELVRRGDTILSMIWDQARKKVELTDSRGHEAHFAYEVSSGRWVSHGSSSQRILQRNGQDVQLMAAIHADFAKYTDGQWRGLQNSDICTDDIRVAPKVPCPCTGPWNRGDAVADTRSWCCYQATNEVNVKCWNQWCIGCCQLLECDAACLIGDYICVCGRSGRECGGPCY